MLRQIPAFGVVTNAVCAVATAEEGAVRHSSAAASATNRVHSAFSGATTQPCYAVENSSRVSCRAR
jgi:hypothetical protein